MERTWRNCLALSLLIHLLLALLLPSSIIPRPEEIENEPIWIHLVEPIGPMEAATPTDPDSEVSPPQPFTVPPAGQAEHGPDLAPWQAEIIPDPPPAGSHTQPGGPMDRIPILPESPPTTPEPGLWVEAPASPPTGPRDESFSERTILAGIIPEELPKSAIPALAPVDHDAPVEPGAVAWGQALDVLPSDLLPLDPPGAVPPAEALALGGPLLYPHPTDVQQKSHPAPRTVAVDPTPWTAHFTPVTADAEPAASNPEPRAHPAPAPNPVPIPAVALTISPAAVAGPPPVTGTPLPAGQLNVASKEPLDSSGASLAAADSHPRPPVASTGRAPGPRQPIDDDLRVSTHGTAFESPAESPEDSLVSGPVPSLGESTIGLKPPIGRELSRGGEPSRRREPTMQAESAPEPGIPMRRAAEGNLDTVREPLLQARTPDGFHGVIDAAAPDEDSPFTGWRQYREPVYPPSLRRRGVEGFVDVQIHTDPAGRVVSWQILRQEGSEFFATAVDAVVSHWEFVMDPTWERLNLAPPPFVVRVEFRLSD